MKRFIITSQKFAGQVEVLYKEEMLCLIDYRNAKLDYLQISTLNRCVPIKESEVTTAFTSYPSLTIIPGEIIVTLDDFIHEYPYKRNMHLLPPVWDKMPQTDKVLAVLAATDYRKYCERNEQWYKPKIAETWLKKKEYLNNWKKL